MKLNGMQIGLGLFLVIVLSIGYAAAAGEYSVSALPGTVHSGDSLDMSLHGTFVPGQRYAIQVQNGQFDTPGTGFSFKVTGVNVQQDSTNVDLNISAAPVSSLRLEYHKGGLTRIIQSSTPGPLGRISLVVTNAFENTQTNDYILINGTPTSNTTAIDIIMEGDLTQNATDIHVPFYIQKVQDGDFTAQLSIDGNVELSQGVTTVVLPDAIDIFRDGLWAIDYNHNYQWDGPAIDRVGNLGQAGDTGLKGDWNGDGIEEIGIFRGGLWALDYNDNFQWNGPSIDRLANIGQAGDNATIGDWNGDGRTAIGIFRDGLWALDYNDNFRWDGPPADVVAWLGVAGDIPVVGDWNGNGARSIGIFRNGLWVLDYNDNFVWDGPVIDRVANLGQAGDNPVVGDWNGDGLDEIGIFRGGLWALDYNDNFVWDGPGNDVVANLGQAGDDPVVEDALGDGRDQIGIFRGGLWALDYNDNFVWDGPDVDKVANLGQALDDPLQARWADV